MKHISDKELDCIKGGDSNSITGPIISALVSVIKLIQEAGYDLGSGFRRIADNEMCPLR